MAIFLSYTGCDLFGASASSAKRSSVISLSEASIPFSSEHSSCLSQSSHSFGSNAPERVTRMLAVFHASQTLFHTGWFVESLATQTLVLLVIRTASNPFHCRPSLALTITTCLAVAVGIFCLLRRLPRA